MVTYILERQRRRSNNLMRDLIGAFNLLASKYERQDALSECIKSAYRMTWCMEPDAEDLISLLLYRAYREERLTTHDFIRTFSEKRYVNYHKKITEACNYKADHCPLKEEARIEYYIMMRLCDKLFASFSQKLNKSNTPHTVYITRAYKFAREAYMWKYGSFGEPFLVHALHVARMLAERGLESKIVAASLLYESVEYMGVDLSEMDRRFGTAVAHCVDCVVRVDREFENAGAGKTSRGRITEMDEPGIEQLKRHISGDRTMVWALYIKAADRIYDLENIEWLPEEARQMRCRSIELNDLPIFRYFRLTHFVAMIEDLVWRCADIGRYHEMEARYQDLLARNRSFTDEMERLLRLHLGEPFSRRCQMIRTEGYDAEVRVRRYRPLEIFEHMRRSGRHAFTPADISKRNMPICDMEIILDPRDTRATTDAFATLFVKMFEDKIAKTGRAITDFYRENDAIFVFHVEDGFRNTYRCCISTRTDYVRAQFGIGEGFTSRESYDEDNPREEKISIQLRNNKFITLPKGSTVIDAAFAIHDEVGYCVTSAIVNGNRVSIYYILQDGDRIIVEADTDRRDGLTVRYEPHVRMEWFNAVATKRARKKLIGFLEYKYERDDEENESTVPNTDVEGAADIHADALKNTDLPD